MEVGTVATDNQVEIESFRINQSETEAVDELKQVLLNVFN